MSYKKWFDNHDKKHQLIIEKLQKKNYLKKQIIEYFQYDNMITKESDFCVLYGENKKCHEMEDLNCYLCACPNFRFNDDGVSCDEGNLIKSECSINNGESLAYNGVIHQDCSQCSIPHHREYIEDNFDYEWKKIMSKCC